MGLSGRKAKQRIPQDPRNLSWADDASRFGSTYLAKLGFDHSDKNATLGISGTGLSQHLKVHHKLDMMGIGAQHTRDPNGIAWKQNQDFENLLKRLNGNSEDPTGDGVNSAPIDGFHRAHVRELTTDTANAGPETEAKDQDGKVKERKSKKKKRPRDDAESAIAEERKSKKRKQVELTTVVPDGEPMTGDPSSSNSPTPESTPVTSNTHRRGRAHRTRFLASKRLAATSSRAVAEILGISSNSVTPLSGSGVATPEVTPLVEDDQHGHLTVSAKSVTEYFKEKMGFMASKSSGFETVTDEAPRGGIGSRPKVCDLGEVEEGERPRGGLGMGLLAKMSAADTVAEIFTQEIPGGKDKKKEEGTGRKPCGEGEEGEVRHRARRKGKSRVKVASD